MLRKLLWMLVVCTAPITLIAQEEKQDDQQWNVSDPYSDQWKINEIPLKTDQGTWMNLDVSPDGKFIVFDLLGDIYKMPVTGGKAKALRSGMPYEIQPRFSPDGKKIAFTSDAGGGDNIWIMNADGSQAKQL